MGVLRGCSFFEPRRLIQVITGFREGILRPMFVDTEKRGAEEQQHDDNRHLCGVVRCGREQEARVFRVRKRTHANGRASLDKGVPDVRKHTVYLHLS